MLNTRKCPDSITHISPSGPCTLTIESTRPQHVDATPRPDQNHRGRAVACLTSPALRIGNATYTAYAAAPINDDLSSQQPHTHLRPDPNTPKTPAPPRHHHARWRQHAARLLTELLTPENYLTLHRADARHRHPRAEKDVTVRTPELRTATENLRRAQVLNTVVHMDNSSHRTIGIELAPTWHGTTDELLTVINALTADITK